MNEHGYPADWDADPVQHESIARNVQANPLIPELSSRLGMLFDGVLPLDEAEAAEWQGKRDRAEAIKRRAIDKEQQSRQAPRRASGRRGRQQAA